MLSKRVSFFLLVFFLLTFLSFSYALQDNRTVNTAYDNTQRENESTCREVVISAHPNYAPFHWEEDGKIVGASIAITGQILDEMNLPWRAEYVGPWKRVLQQAHSGNIDLIPALKRTAQREEFLSFTNSVFYSNPVAIYRSNNEDSQAVSSLVELDGLIGSVNAGDNHGSQIDAFLSKQNIAQIKGIKENFEMLKMGRTDYFVMGKHTAQSFLQAHNLSDAFTIVLELNNAVVHHGFSKRSPCKTWLSEFDRRMTEKLISGEVDFAIEQYKSIWLEKKLFEE